MTRDNIENRTNTSSIGSGFLLGLLIGVLVTLLMTTKKGREILRDLMDRVIKKISELDDRLEGINYDPDEQVSTSLVDNDYVKPVVEAVNNKEVEGVVENQAVANQNDSNGHKSDIKGASTSAIEKNDKPEKQGVKRLFFKKIKKN